MRRQPTVSTPNAAGSKPAIALARRLCGAWLLCLLASGCASRPPEPSTYDALGGRDGIQALVDDLLEVMVDDPRINFQFAKTDILRFREKLAEQICVESGGPCRYTGLTMQESHAGRNIDDTQFNALVEDLVKVMERRQVPVSAQNRLLRRLAPMHKDVVGIEGTPTVPPETEVPPEASPAATP